MGGYYNTGVPTSVELENNKNSKKYTVNKEFSNGIVIQKSLCALMAIGALLLAVIAGLLVFFLVPRCTRADVTKESTNPIIEPLLDDKHDNDILRPFTKEYRSVEKDERLPRSIVPKHYRLQIIPFIENSTLVGVETITLNVIESTDEIIFNLKDLKIDQESVRVKSEQGDREFKVTEQAYIDVEKYKITLNSKLEQGANYLLEFMFDGSISMALNGVYRSHYKDVTYGETKYLVATQFSPNDARKAFPCFDEPSFKAKFSISIGRRDNVTAISNMPIMDKPEPFIDNAGWLWDHFEETPEMSTYLVAFIVSDLMPYKKSVNNSIQLWAKSDSISQVRYAAMTSEKVIEFMEKYTNIKFTLPKIDIVAVPDFGFSAMENWGLITFRESKLLFDSHNSNMNNMRDVATVLAHELAHQWFGNLVTPKWWNNLWLKEGFATYFQYLAVDYAEDTWNIKEEFIASELSEAFEIDSLRNARPLSDDILSNKQVRQLFSRIAYTKGSSLANMLSNFVGEDLFRESIVKYLDKYKYSNADEDDLFTILTQEVQNKSIIDESTTINDIMHTWTRQPGFPVVTVEATRSNGTITLTLSQHRYLYISSEKDDSTWWIPISVATDIDPSYDTVPDIWMRKGQPAMKTVINADKWYLLNINHTGYFIVNYDPENWKAFLNTRLFMSFPTTTRAELISDSMDLARAGLLDYHIPLTIIGNMARNDSDIMFVPTFMAFNKLEYLSEMLISTPVFGDFEKYVQSVFRRTFERVTFDAANLDIYLTQRILTTVTQWSCRRFDSMCAIDSLKLFREMMSTGKSVPQNIREVVYCAALRFGGVDEWTFAYRRYLETRIPSEKAALLRALGCTNEKWLLSSYLEFLIDNNTSIRSQDAANIFGYVAANHNGYRMAFDFIRENWDIISRKYGEGGFNMVGKIIQTISTYMNSEYQLMELLEFKKMVKGKIGNAEEAFGTAIEKVQANVYWMKKNYRSLERWFKSHQVHFGI